MILQQYNHAMKGHLKIVSFWLDSIKTIAKKNYKSQVAKHRTTISVAGLQINM